ncbi:uncharacterized protein ACN63O_023241, partial [Diretmus argenteus]
MVMDATKPKGKTYSYIYFAQTFRKELDKKCADQWRTMSAKAKVKFEALAKTDKARYDEEMRSYVPPEGTKAKRDTPKRPRQAYVLFSSDHRANIKAEHPGMSFDDISKKLGALWSKQGPRDKAPYEAEAAKLREKYEKDVAAYKAKGGPGESDAGKKGGPARPTGKKPAPDDDEEDHEEDDEEMRSYVPPKGTKPKRKTSSYAYFAQTFRKELDKKCTDRWRTMSAKEKVKFEALAKTDKARYDEEMRSYVPPEGTKAKRDAPKRPGHAYFLFSSDHRANIKAEHPGISFDDISKKLGALWSKQGPRDKAPYEAEAAKLREKYEK